MHHRFVYVGNRFIRSGARRDGRADDEEFALYRADRRADLGIVAVRPRDTDDGVELVDRTVRFDARIGFGYLLPSA
jgi:hypothetical protein